MPIIKSARKALRQNKRRQAKNLKQAEEYKDAVKALKKLLVKKGKKEAAALLPKVYKMLDKAAKTHIIEKNKASRLKAQLSRSVNKLS